MPSILSGFLNIDKAAGMTSHDVVAQVRRLSRQKRVGHGGTLDPAATGVLPIGLGDATRLLEYLVEGKKSYQAIIRLGSTTTTDDAEGPLITSAPVPSLTTTDLEAAFAPFIGVIAQVPPAYSAIQVAGQRMYDLARQGQEIELPPRTVEIDRIALLDWSSPDVSVLVTCGKGTYIRALARDVGAALGCGAHLARLRRTAVGPLAVEQAITLDALRADPNLLSARMLSPAAAVADWPRAVVDEPTRQAIRHGRAVPLSGVEGDRACAYDSHDTLIALLAPLGDLWQPYKVLRST
ncbi:MAG: tRNA pseudouridine(55) synthase TruB [Herpetosiphonaceae bacterium]|nr:tRNA pseudouridine(55) synthase TruB [Herpetosiphonaceae bacterium]